MYLILMKEGFPMNELIPVSNQVLNGTPTQTINARDLHEFLEMEKKFSDWIKDQIVRARLVEGIDYIAITVNPKEGKNPLGGRPKKEYHVTTDAAKDIGMISGSEKGIEVRNYFKECERLAKIAFQNKAAKTEIELAEERLAETQRLIDSLKEKEALKRIIDNHTLFGKSNPLDSQLDAVSLKDIKESYGWMPKGRIRQVLMHYEHPETIFNVPNSKITKSMFIEDGIDEVLECFYNEADKFISRSKQSLVLNHDCLLGSPIRIPKEIAIEYLEYSEEDFI
jgi:phage anti-repressor protein